MKKIVLLATILIFSLSFFAQSIDVGSAEEGTVDLKGDKVRSTIETDGSFVVANTDQVNSLKFRIDANGEVNWFLDKQLMYIRDGHFEAFPDVFTQYDFLHIDGTTGRIGFNVLGDEQYGELPLTSSIHLYGSIATRVRTLDGTGDYAIQPDDHTLVVVLNEEDATINLPSATTSKGRQYKFKRDADAGNKNDVIIEASGNEQIDDDNSYTISKTLGVVEMVSDGTRWWIMSEEEQLASDEVGDNTILSDNEDFVGVVFTETTKTITLTLPPAAIHDDKIYEIKRNSDGVTPDGCTLYVVPTGSEKLDEFDATTKYTMSNDYESLRVVSSGARWLILGNYGHTPPPAK